MKHRIDATERDRIIQKIREYFLASKHTIDTVYLYGTFAASEPFQDIDIGILSDKAVPNRLDVELKLEGSLEAILAFPVDIRVLNDAPLSFSQNVIRNGKVIIDRNPNRRADFEGRVLKEYFDFSPFQRQYLQEITNAPI